MDDDPCFRRRQRSGNRGQQGRDVLIRDPTSSRGRGARQRDRFKVEERRGRHAPHADPDRRSVAARFDDDGREGGVRFRSESSGAVLRQRTSSEFPARLAPAVHGRSRRAGARVERIAARARARRRHRRREETGERRARRPRHRGNGRRNGQRESDPQRGDESARRVHDSLGAVRQSGRNRNRAAGHEVGLCRRLRENEARSRRDHERRLHHAAARHSDHGSRRRPAKESGARRERGPHAMARRAVRSAHAGLPLRRRKLHDRRGRQRRASHHPRQVRRQRDRRDPGAEEHRRAAARREITAAERHRRARRRALRTCCFR